VAHVHQRPLHEGGKLGLLARPRFLECLLEVAARRGQRYAHAFGSRFEALPTGWNCTGRYLATLVERSSVKASET
jgi:hypothetical protein